MSAFLSTYARGGGWDVKEREREKEREKEKETRTVCINVLRYYCVHYKNPVHILNMYMATQVITTHTPRTPEKKCDDDMMILVYSGM